jgi:hypothetical protein
MTQQAAKTMNSYYPGLTAIKGGLFNQSAAVKKLTHTAWVIAYTAL